MFSSSSSSGFTTWIVDAKMRFADCELRDEQTEPTLLFLKLLVSFSRKFESSFLTILNLSDEPPTADCRNMLGMRDKRVENDGLFVLSNSSMSIKNFSRLFPCFLPAILIKFFIYPSQKAFLWKWYALLLDSIRQRSRMVTPSEKIPLVGAEPRLFFAKYALNYSGEGQMSWCSLLFGPLRIKHCKLLGELSKPESITLMVDSLACTPTKICAILTFVFCPPALSTAAYPLIAEYRILVISSLSNCSLFSMRLWNSRLRLINGYQSSNIIFLESLKKPSTFLWKISKDKDEGTFDTQKLLTPCLLLFLLHECTIDGLTILFIFEDNIFAEEEVLVFYALHYTAAAKKPIFIVGDKVVLGQYCRLCGFAGLRLEEWIELACWCLFLQRFSYI